MPDTSPSAAGYPDEAPASPVELDACEPPRERRRPGRHVHDTDCVRRPTLRRRRPAGDAATDLDAWRRDIDEHGWVVVFVPDGEHGQFHFTVGLTELGLAELITYGLPAQEGTLLLNDLAACLRAGQVFPDDVDITELTRTPLRLRLRTATRLVDPLGVAHALYGDRLAVRQLVLPDSENRLPWEDGYADTPVQPLLFDPPSSPLAGHG